MDGGGRGDPGHEEDPFADQEGLAEVGGRHGASIQDDRRDDEKGEMEGTVDRRQRVRLNITARRVRIDPRKKRRSYISRLERLMRECDRIISDPEGYEEIQVQAMAILIRAIKVCYGLVTDEQVETLEEEFEALKRRIAERIRAGKPEA